MLPTPTATPYGNNQSPSAGAAVRPSLDSLAKNLLPTPRATDGTKGGPNQRGSKGDLMLPSAVAQLLPTPRVSDSNGGGSTVTEAPTSEPPSVSSLLPTPTANLATNGGTQHPAKRRAGGASAVDCGCDRAPWGRYATAIHRWEQVTGRAAPAPVDERGRLAPVFVEWMQGLNKGHVTAVPGLTRSQMLRALGNGVMPQQGTTAIHILLDRMSTARQQAAA